jgi:hypothetical protein
MSSAERGAAQAGEGDRTSGAVSPSDRPGRWYGSLSPTDLGINVALGSLFLWAHIETLAFTFRAGLFPRVISGAGVLLCLMRLVTAVRARHAHTDADDGSSPDESALTDTEETESVDVEYVFAHASSRDWVTSLAWIAGFILTLGLLGIYIAAPLFALVYLSVVAKTRWWVSLLYAAVTWVVLYWTFDVLLRIRMPSGVYF